MKLTLFLRKAAINLTPEQCGMPVFESPFKRIHIDSEEYLGNLIIYIHQNPENFQNYKFSSYLAVISDTGPHVQRSEVIYLFGDHKNFVEYHKES